MPYRLATPQYSVNGVYYSTVYEKKQAILMRFVKIEKVFVRPKVTLKEVWSSLPCKKGERFAIESFLKKNETRYLPFQAERGIIEDTNFRVRSTLRRNYGKRIQKRE